MQRHIEQTTPLPTSLSKRLSLCIHPFKQTALIHIISDLVSVQSSCGVIYILIFNLPLNFAFWHNNGPSLLWSCVTNGISADKIRIQYHNNNNITISPTGTYYVCILSICEYLLSELERSSRTVITIICRIIARPASPPPRQLSPHHHHQHHTSHPHLPTSSLPFYSLNLK